MENILRNAALCCLVLCVKFYTTTPLPLAPRENYVNDYCWRDFEGAIPPDAFKAGNDSSKQIYVGQVLYENKLIPGKIQQGKRNIYFEWSHKELSKTENIKVLCTNYPEKFVWIPTQDLEAHLLTDQILVKGGFESDYRTYIGRVFTNGKMLVGKVMCTARKCLGLYTTNDGGFKQHQVFEILSYNPNVNLEPLIDVRYES